MHKLNCWLGVRSSLMLWPEIIVPLSGMLPLTICLFSIVHPGKAVHVNIVFISYCTIYDLNIITWEREVQRRGNLSQLNRFWQSYHVKVKCVQMYIYRKSWHFSALAAVLNSLISVWHISPIWINHTLVYQKCSPLLLWNLLGHNGCVRECICCRLANGRLVNCWWFRYLQALPLDTFMGIRQWWALYH